MTHKHSKEWHCSGICCIWRCHITFTATWWKCCTIRLSLCDTPPCSAVKPLVPDSLTQYHLSGLQQNNLALSHYRHHLKFCFLTDAFSQKLTRKVISHQQVLNIELQLQCIFLTCLTGFGVHTSRQDNSCMKPLDTWGARHHVSTWELFGCYSTINTQHLGLPLLFLRIPSVTKTSRDRQWCFLQSSNRSFPCGGMQHLKCWLTRMSCPAWECTWHDPLKQ